MIPLGQSTLLKETRLWTFATLTPITLGSLDEDLRMKHGDVPGMNTEV